MKTYMNKCIHGVPAMIGNVGFGDIFSFLGPNAGGFGASGFCGICRLSDSVIMEQKSINTDYTHY